MINRRDALLFGGALALGGAYAFWPRGQENNTNLPSFDMSANAQEMPDIDVPEYTMGAEEAPIKVVEYASFTCVHCANFHNDTFKAFKEEFIDTGRVHFTYREVYFDRYGLWAGMVARCAGEDRYFPMTSLIYETQDEWSRAGDPATVAATLKRLGLRAGLDSETLDACMQDAEMAQAMMARFQENAERDNLRSTPSFLINGEMHAGNMPIGQLRGLIEAEEAKL